MIITTKQFLSSVWLVIALIVATILAVALPRTSYAQSITSNEFISEGYASWYNMGQHGAKTASGERYDHKAMTAAHPSLPYNSMVKVTNIDTNTFVVVRINDRLNSGAKHIIDLSGAAAQKIGLFESSTAEVNLVLMENEGLTLNSTSQTTFKVDTSQIPIVPCEASVDDNQSGLIQGVSIQHVNVKSAFTLQIGSFSTIERAQLLADLYDEAWVDRVENGGESTFRVYFSRFEKEQPARVAQYDLWSKGQDSFLRKVAP